MYLKLGGKDIYIGGQPLRFVNMIIIMVLMIINIVVVKDSKTASLVASIQFFFLVINFGITFLTRADNKRIKENPKSVLIPHAALLDANHNLLLIDAIEDDNHFAKFRMYTKIAMDNLIPCTMVLKILDSIPDEVEAKDQDQGAIMYNVFKNIISNNKSKLKYSKKLYSKSIYNWYIDHGFHVFTACDAVNFSSGWGLFIPLLIEKHLCDSLEVIHSWSDEDFYYNIKIMNSTYKD